MGPAGPAASQMARSFTTALSKDMDTIPDNICMSGKSSEKE